MADELAEELDFHRALKQHEFEQEGFSPQESGYAARRALGNETLAREDSRSVWLSPWLESVVQDISHAVRGLRRDPFLTLIATVILAVSIGGNAAIFSVANAVLIRPLPYPGAERIDWISERSGPTQQNFGVAPDYFYLRHENRIFEDVAAYNPTSVNWTGVENPEQLNAAAVTPSFFNVMGMRPMLGRYLAPDEQGSEAPAVLVLSYDFWRNRLDGDRHAVGKTIALDRKPRTIVGVMPRGFDFPRGSQMWLPLTLNEATESFPISPTRPIFGVGILVRRKAGLTSEQIEADIKRLTEAIQAQYEPLRERGFRTDLNIGGIPLQRHLTGDLRPAVLAIAAAAGLVLLVACVNLASLLLARAGARRRELAVRMALGSGRGRVIRQVLTESMVLALPGGAAGVALAWISLRVLEGLKPEILTPYPAISMDIGVLAFTAAVTIATSLLFGLMPALSASGIHVQDALRTSDRAQSASGVAGSRKALVVVELGVCLILLIGAGLLTRSLFHLGDTELGFDKEHLLTFGVNPIDSLGRDETPFYQELLDRLQQTPSLQSAALVSDMPLNRERFYQTGKIQVAGRPPLPFVDRPTTNNSLVSPGFLRTLRVPLRAGRFFEVQDFDQSQQVAVPGFVAAEPVVVNETFVRRIFPGENPIGRRLLFGPDERNITWTIIGVVGDVSGPTLGADPPSMVYRCSCSGNPIYRAGFIVRTAGDPSGAVRLIEQQVWAVDPDQPIFDVRTMDERVQAALTSGRVAILLAGAFALVATLLAAAGVYGVMSYLVACRKREIGIRVALGARPFNILNLVLAETAFLALASVVLGLGGGWAFTRYIRSLLHGVNELDPVTFLSMPAVLVVIVIVASLGPSFRALHVDPMTALREE
jgi:predicted permease